MALAVGSAGVTMIAMLIHTKSPFLTLMGLFQILLSFPLAYFVYYFIGGLAFFPFLNFIGIFVVFALGEFGVLLVLAWPFAIYDLPTPLSFLNCLTTQVLTTCLWQLISGKMQETSYPMAQLNKWQLLHCQMQRMQCF